MWLSAICASITSKFLSLLSRNLFPILYQNIPFCFSVTVRIWDQNFVNFALTSFYFLTFQSECSSNFNAIRRFPSSIVSNFDRYSAGAMPWGTPTDEETLQKIDDKKLEVVGLTTASLVSHHSVRL